MRQGKSAASASAWLSLGEASRLLGITPATLRRWADQGDVAAFVTPGGHRRFRRTVIEALAPGRTGSTAPAVATTPSATRVARAYRRGTPAGRAPRPSGPALPESVRSDFRERGRRLLDMLLVFLDTDRRPHRLAGATRAAADYGARAAAAEVSLSDTVDAFVRFRQALRGELAMLARRRRLDTDQATSLLVDAERAADGLLVALVAGHNGGGHHRDMA